MIIRVLPSARRAAEAVAQFVAECLTAEPQLVLALPTGRTPVDMYSALERLHRRGRADFSHATTFNLDEFVGLAPDARASYRAFMQRHLVAHVNLDDRRVHVPRGDATSPAREAARYEQAIADSGGLDVAVLGIGANGHIGFNEPGPTLSARTHVVGLTLGSRRANRAAFRGRTADVPSHAISMGVGTILSADTVVLLATGRAKAGIDRKALAGPITTRVPASLLQTHPRCLVVLDRAAASGLTI
jgi:glucosamine-6-phosphate deaminase